MLVGHFAVGLTARRIEPSVSLGTFVLAAMFADLLWCARLDGAADVAVSHSLLMDGVWAVCLAAAYYLVRRHLRGAVIVGAAVLSHWLLDWISHGPDMPLAPGVHRYFGLGLWTSVPATLVVEGGFWLLAVLLYARSTRPMSLAGALGYWGVVAILTLAWYGNITRPVPLNPHNPPVASLVFFSLAVAWAWWMNHARPTRTPPAPSSPPLPTPQSPHPAVRS